MKLNTFRTEEYLKALSLSYSGVSLVTAFRFGIYLLYRSQPDMTDQQEDLIRTRETVRASLVEGYV